MMMGSTEQLAVLRFAASFLWADLEIDEREEAFFVGLARELGISKRAMPQVVEMLRAPPAPEHVDPTRVPSALAARVRDAALRAIASDGRVAPREMELWDLLDELLPGGGSACSAPSLREAPPAGASHGPGVVRLRRTARKRAADTPA
jgi:hypothetical protein